MATMQRHSTITPPMMVPSKPNMLLQQDVSVMAAFQMTAIQHAYIKNGVDAKAIKVKASRRGSPVSVAQAIDSATALLEAEEDEDIAVPAPAVNKTTTKKSKTGKKSKKTSKPVASPQDVSPMRLSTRKSLRRVRSTASTNSNSSSDTKRTVRFAQDLEQVKEVDYLYSTDDHMDELWWSPQEMKAVQCRAIAVRADFLDLKDDQVWDMEDVWDTCMEGNISNAKLAEEKVLSFLQGVFDGEARGLEPHILTALAEHRQNGMDAVLDRHDALQMDEKKIHLKECLIAAKAKEFSKPSALFARVVALVDARVAHQILYTARVA